MEGKTVRKISSEMRVENTTSKVNRGRIRLSILPVTGGSSRKFGGWGWVGKMDPQTSLY